VASTVTLNVEGDVRLPWEILEAYFQQRRASKKVIQDMGR